MVIDQYYEYIMESILFEQEIFKTNYLIEYTLCNEAEENQTKFQQFKERIIKLFKKAKEVIVGKIKKLKSFLKSFNLKDKLNKVKRAKDDKEEYDDSDMKVEDQEILIPWYYASAGNIWDAMTLIHHEMVIEISKFNTECTLFDKLDKDKLDMKKQKAFDAMNIYIMKQCSNFAKNNNVSFDDSGSALENLKVFEPTNIRKTKEKIHFSIPSMYEKELENLEKRMDSNINSLDKDIKVKVLPKMEAYIDRINKHIKEVEQIRSNPGQDTIFMGYLSQLYNYELSVTMKGQDLTIKTITYYEKEFSDVLDWILKYGYGWDEDEDYF